jgi:site-specific DNA-methyltransferase (adenine-specific)
MKNLLYYGDNLDVLRRHIDDEVADLVYLDPPFNSSQDYNVLFAEHDGTKAAAQIKAFGDTWKWDESAARAYQEVVEAGGRVSEVLQAFRLYLDRTDMLAYISMMAPRLVELRRVMKPTASIYLHCDATASHYLKVVMDATFGPENFRNEIIWQRTLAKGLQTRRLAQNHDVILTYQKSDQAYFNLDSTFQPYDEDDLSEKTAGKYGLRDEDGRRYQLTSLLNPNTDRPNLKYEFLGVTRVWRWTQERMQAAYEAGMVVQTQPGTVPRFKRYLDEQRGMPLHDVWTDIPPINARAKERLGYPTQKPVALLERIVKMSCPPDGVVLDPFCGCGTSISAGQRLERRWIGIDITHLAIGLIRSRLRGEFGEEVSKTYKVIGEPTTVEDAMELAHEDPYQFQWWALGLVGARRDEEKKGADRGIDGKLAFHDEGLAGKTKNVVISVKAGRLHANHVRDLRGVIERDRAEIGVLISMEEPTKPMRSEAANAGFYKSPYGTDHPRLQFLTIHDLLHGKGIDYPAPRQTNVTTKRARRHVKDDEARKLF